MNRLMLVALLLGGCKGDADGPGKAGTVSTTDTDTDGVGPTDVPEVEPSLGVGEVGARRLSRAEYDATIDTLLGDDTQPATLGLPADVVDPFDNDFTTQEVSAVLVSGLEGLANQVASRLVADPVRRAEVVPCEPTGADDVACLEAFARDFGRLALRRPVEDDEVDAWVALGATFAADAGDFWDGIDVMTRVFLQHPHFVYRIELGTETQEPGVFLLDGYEVATRLSYLLWGTTPSRWLLDQAEQGVLDTPQGIRTTAETLLDDEAARARIDRFHAMWLGYWQLPHDPDLTAAFRAESRALVDDVVFDRQASWLELFTAQETWIDDTLAAHYGLASPGGPAWVSYGNSGRQGLLSHGSFLSVNAKFGDTSPTLRGKLVRERLLCQVIPPPPPGVNVDEPPQGEVGDCKEDRYAVHASSGSCSGCHALIDPIGFGLENFDQPGVYREHDVGDPDCLISGEGDLDGDPFQGPAGLADLLVEGETLTRCAVQQSFRLALGHSPTDLDLPYLDRLNDSFPAADHRLDQLLLDLVSDEAFQYRREEEAP